MHGFNALSMPESPEISLEDSNLIIICFLYA